ncbi:phospholipid carrier-dependent glycosyltransferase [Glutamicibacter endophyticus]
MSTTVSRPTVHATVQSSRQAFSAASLRARLLLATAPRDVRTWLIPVVITVLAGVLRMVNLEHPHLLIFDETYYVKDAYSLLHHGYEMEWVKDSNEQFIAGNPQLTGEPSYVVHPPLGKWLIALGMALFGEFNGFGWRFATAVAGTLSVLLVVLCARRLFASHLLAGLAGLFMAVDGHSIVLSRTGLLDIFLMFFLLAGFYFLVLDREFARKRLIRALSVPEGHKPDDFSLLHGPFLPWRPWRLAAAVMLGCAVSVKWSALAFIAVFCVLSVLWDFSARRTIGIRHWFQASFVKDGLYAFFTMMPMVLITYLSSWTGWLVSTGAKYRNWAAEHPGEGLAWLPESLRSLWHYHQSAYQFHTGLGSEHGWASAPWTWPFAGRPVLMYFEGYDQGVNGCTVSRCTEVITDLPNPVMWLAATLSMFLLILWWAGARDWRAGAILSSVVAGFLPWLMYPERTMFFFYTLPLVPFMCLALTYMIGRFLPAPSEPRGTDHTRVLLVGIFVALVLLTSAFFWPIWSGEMIDDAYWKAHLWIPSWG